MTVQELEISEGEALWKIKAATEAAFCGGGGLGQGAGSGKAWKGMRFWAG